MSILRNNWHWMLFSLTVFGSISVLIFTQLNTDAEPETVYNPPSEEIIQGIREKSDAQKAQETDGTKRPPPPGETHETGYWHDDHWHRNDSHAPKAKPEQRFTATEISKYWDGSIGPNGEPIPINSKQRAELRRIRRYLSIGIEPPPKGYDYLLIDDKEIVLDNGRPFLINMETDSTQYWITTRIGFAPTIQQYDRYQELQRKLKGAKRDNDTTLVQQLSAEIDSLTAEAQGKLPSFSTLGRASHSEYGTEAFERSLAEKRKPILRAAYRHMGLEHLLRPEPRTIIIDGQELEILEDE